MKKREPVLSAPSQEGLTVKKMESREKEPRVILSFDVGATNLRGAIVTLNSGATSITFREVSPTPQGNPQAVIDAIVKTGRSIIQQARARGIEPVGIGISFCGHFDDEGRPGYLIWAGNLRLRNVEMGGPIQEALGMPVEMINDVSAAALAESRERKLDNLAAVFIGTGVGLGVVIGGRPAEKIGNQSDLIMKRSHSPYKPGGAPCPVGCNGCFQSYIGGRSLGLRAKEAGLAEDASGLIAKWREGDNKAKLIVNEALQAMKVFVGLIKKEFNPGKIVIGGTVADNFLELIQVANEVMEAEPAILGENAPLLGAAELAADS